MLTTHTRTLLLETKDNTRLKFIFSSKKTGTVVHIQPSTDKQNAYKHILQRLHNNADTLSMPAQQENYNFGHYIRISSAWPHNTKTYFFLSLLCPCSLNYLYTKSYIFQMLWTLHCIFTTIWNECAVHCIVTATIYVWLVSIS